MKYSLRFYIYLGTQVYNYIYFRQWSSYGTYIPKEEMAFSDPTADGKMLAAKYMGTADFLVYKFQWAESPITWDVQDEK